MSGLFKPWKNTYGSMINEIIYIIHNLNKTKKKIIHFLYISLNDLNAKYWKIANIERYKSNFSSNYSGNTYVFKFDVNSEYGAHAWQKICGLWRKIRFVTALM